MNQATHSTISTTLLYHEQTKHHFQRYARSAGSLDWANQPNPFRVYAEVPTIRLPLRQVDPVRESLALYDRRRNPFAKFTRETIGAFLELSLGLSAWKSVPDNEWALRINPSSGNLHPTEAHLILPALPGIEAGLFHYNSYFHALEQRAKVPRPLWQQIHTHLQADGFFVALTSIFWREAWKYGERAFRYCQHDIGHALAALSFSANLLGWKVTWLTAVSDAEIAQLLGFAPWRWPAAEAEQPELLCFIHRSGPQQIPNELPAEIVAAFAKLEIQGTPNQLSAAHVDWEIIARVAEATTKAKAPAKTRQLARCPNEPGVSRSYSAPLSASEIPAGQLIRQRRSAVAFDEVSHLAKAQFFSMLDKTLPRTDGAPFDLGLTEAAIHLLVFVHRVTGLEPGLYFLLRSEGDLSAVQQQCHPALLWQPAEAGLPLYLLQAGDFQSRATTLSCQQNIAGDGVFSLGMLARFREEISAGAHRYRQLFWEAGMIGQVLYLEAEAHGLRGTGIGCFFDDPVHQLLGLTDNTFQSLYHFTVGGPEDDTRLATRAAYHHLAAPVH